MEETKIELRMQKYHEETTRKGFLYVSYSAEDMPGEDVEQAKNMIRSFADEFERRFINKRKSGS